MVQFHTVNSNYRAYNSQNQSIPKNVVFPSFTAKLPDVASNFKPKSFMAIVAAILAGTLTMGAVTEHSSHGNHIEDPRQAKAELVIKNQNKVDLLSGHQPHTHAEEYEKCLPKLRKGEIHIEPPKDKSKLLGNKSASFLNLTKKIIRKG